MSKTRVPPVTTAPVLYDKSGAIALVTLNRPEVLNAYNVAMRDALYGIFQAVRDDPGVRVVILQGNGPAFCSGGDIREFGTAPSPVAARTIRWQRDVWGLFWSLPAITVAAVYGAVVGSGLEMMVLCDIAIASADARFALPETGLGMIPGVAGTQTVPRLLGLGRGLDLVLTGRWLDAKAARRLGMVSRVVPAQRLRTAALRRARRLAQIPAPLAAALKRTINSTWELPLTEGLALEQRLAWSN